jgi:ankyrin repeat protein
MLTLYDIAHYVAWNGYAEDMLPYLGVDKAAWTNKEFQFPYVVNFRYGEHKKTRIQRICEKMTPTYDNKNYYKYAMAKDYNPITRIQELLELGAKPLPDANGWSALLECSRNAWQRHKEIVEILIKAGADVNQESNGWTPLFLASYNNNIPIVRVLLANGANVNHKEYEKTPLSAACTMGNLEIVKLLVSNGATLTGKLYEDAIDRGHIPVIKYLATMLPVPADSIAYALDWNISTIPILAKLGGDVNYVVNGETLIEQNISDEANLRVLLKAGADPNRTGTPNANPPIFECLYHCEPGPVKALCNYADVNILCDVHRNNTISTPLHHVITLVSIHPDEERIEMAKILIKKSDLTLKDSHGNTAIEWAKYKKLDYLVIPMKRELLRRKK